MKSRSFCLATSLLLLTMSAQAQDPDLRALFPQRAAVSVEAKEGLVRLELAAAVISACRSDLSDLRLIDEAGRQVPYILDAGGVHDQQAELQRTEDAPVLELFRERFGERPRGWRERVVLEAPRTAPEGEAWELQLVSSRDRFVVRVHIEALAADGSRATLVNEASIFRLERPQQQRLEVPLPTTTAQRIEVTLESREGGYLDPSFRYRSARGLLSQGQITVPLRTLAIRDQEGATTVELERPPGLVPEALQLETATAAFQRRVEIHDEGGAAADELLGASELFRLEAGLLLEDRRLEDSTVELRRARGARLVVRIDDGDSPRLEELSFVAILRRPSILFAAPEGSVALYFGGARAHRPIYDIAGLLQSPPLAGVRAELAAGLFDQAINADLGAIEDNPRYDRSPPLAFAMRAGTEIDTRAYSHRRELDVPQSEQGLAAFSFGVADLALLRSDLADLRVVDSESRQWPFVLQRDAEEIEIDLENERETEDRTSTYSLELPASPSQLSGLALDFDAPFFDRSYRLEGRPVPRAGERARSSQKEWTVLAAGRLQRQAPQRSLLRFDLAPRRLLGLRMVVEDGDDSPLRPTSVRGRFALPELFLAAPRGSYLLLLGYPEDRAPRYELERVRDLVLALDSAPIDAGPLVPNDEFDGAARITGGEGVQRYLLWAAIGVAVVGLTVLTLRIARSESR